MEVPFLSIDVRVWIPTTATCEEYNNSTAQVDTTSSNDVDRRNRGCMFARCWERSSIVIDVGVRLGSSTRYSIGSVHGVLSLMEEVLARVDRAPPLLFKL